MERFVFEFLGFSSGIPFFSPRSPPWKSEQGISDLCQGQKVTRPALQKDERYPTGIDPGTKPSLFFKVKSPTSTGLHERSGIVQGTHYIRHASYLTRCCTAAEEICCLIQSYMDLDSSDVDWVDLKVEGVRSARSLIQPSN